MKRGTATGACLLDLHRHFSHQASHTTQPPRGGAAAASACVAARAATPNSEEVWYAAFQIALTAVLKARF